MPRKISKTKKIGVKREPTDKQGIRGLGVLIERMDGKLDREIRHLGVKIEAVDDSVKLIAEQYGDIEKKLDSHGAKLDAQEAKLDAHGAKLDSHAEMIGLVKEDTEIIKLEIEFIKNSLKKKVDIEEFALLEKRVSTLESLLGKRR